MAGFPVQVGTQEGQAITVGNTKITPYSWFMRVNLRLPFYTAGWVWNRPVAVTVQTGDNPPERLPVVDITRLVQIWLLCIGFLGMTMIRRKKK